MPCQREGSSGGATASQYACRRHALVCASTIPATGTRLHTPHFRVCKGSFLSAEAQKSGVLRNGAPRKEQREIESGFSCRSGSAALHSHRRSAVARQRPDWIAAWFASYQHDSRCLFSACFAGRYRASPSIPARTSKLSATRSLAVPRGRSPIRTRSALPPQRPSRSPTTRPAGVRRRAARWIHMQHATCATASAFPYEPDSPTCLKSVSTDFVR